MDGGGGGGGCSLAASDHSLLSVQVRSPQQSPHGLNKLQPVHKRKEEARKVKLVLVFLPQGPPLESRNHGVKWTPR